MISYEGLAMVAVGFGLIAALQFWQDHQRRRDQEQEQRRATLPPAE